MIAVNDAYRLCPAADVLYACDLRWWRHWIEHIRQHFRGELATQIHSQLRNKAQRQTLERFIDRHGMTALTSSPGAGFSTRPGHIHQGKNSGYQAVNLAIQRGATEVLLLGFNMGPVGGKEHWFGDHPGGMQRSSPYGLMVAAFQAAAGQLDELGVRIVNCTPNSALTCFETAHIEDFACT